jgi:hypothetical protein
LATNSHNTLSTTSGRTIQNGHVIKFWLGFGHYSHGRLWTLQPGYQSQPTNTYSIVTTKTYQGTKQSFLPTASFHIVIMAGPKKGENQKKVSGNAKKAEAAAAKAAVENSKKAQAEDEEWGKGAKSTAKK